MYFHQSPQLAITTEGATLPMGAAQGAPPMGAAQGAPPMGAAQGAPPMGAAQGAPPMGAAQGAPPMGAAQGAPPMGAAQGAPPMGAEISVHKKLYDKLEWFERFALEWKNTIYEVFKTANFVLSIVAMMVS